MYFKQIELFGFKSFADRTQVFLEPGITGIVGPNGCGKSNILDALRWALGEQSAKTLRGSHMQDVIFNGSEDRPATGMAEVTLTFDNADSRLPVDFAEVQVTRRLYRSGESEYLLNKAPCRLRDIQEMFMDTGIGTNAYSLIGQGKIDLVLSSKPEDRRFLFEEAAGIIKYKTRKRIAMRKMESADQNLLRLGDIIAEVQRQMRSLKRQVNAAIRHRELTAELRQLEIRNAWLQYNELSGRITDLKQRFAAAQNVYEKASAETSRLEAQLEELNVNRIEIERTLMARRESEHQIDAEMERIENQVALLRKDIEFTRQRREQAQQEGEAFRERAGAILSAQDQTGRQAASLGADIQLAQRALADSLEAHQKAIQETERADAVLETMRATAIENINTRNRAQTELETLGVSVTNIDTQLAAIQEQQTSVQERDQALMAQIAELQAQKEEKRRALDEIRQQMQRLQQERAEIAEKLLRQQEEWQDLREKKSSQDARLASFRELRASYEGFAAGVRAVMTAKQQNHPEMQGIIGPIGDLLSTPKEYERAIEAALGGNINNVVVQKADAAKAAITFLKQQQAGRVTFLPLDTIRSSTRDDGDALRGRRGVIGNAIDYVQCDPGLMPAVQYLLFNTVIVETIDDAIQIARSEQRFPRLVTLEGEVVSSAGAVTGGRTKHEGRGLLGRGAEIEELEQDVDRAAKRLEAIGVEVQALAQSRERSEAVAKELESVEAAARAEMGELGVAAARLAAERDSLRQTGTQLDRQREALLSQRRDLEQRLKAVQERASLMDVDEETRRQRVAEAQAAAAEARQKLAALSAQLGDLRVQLAAQTQSMEEIERNKLREQRDHAEALEEAARRDEQIAQLDLHEKDIERQIAENLSQAKNLSKNRDSAHRKVVESQNQQQALLEKTEGLAQSLKELRAAAAAAQKDVHALELDLSHNEDQVRFFQDRIQTDYGLALASLTQDEVGSDDYDENERTELIADHRRRIERLGVVNLMAIEEYEALEARNAFLVAQDEDLRKAREKLLSVVDRIDKTILDMFMDTFNKIGESFKAYFRRLFNGGQARIYLLDEDDPLESGIEIEARPPGKKPQAISLLSGGEQAMTAIALLFAIFSAKPSPFCVLDEVDAALDDSNIERFHTILEEFARQSQFIIITHNKQTMSRTNALYGVTQQERGVSQLVSVRFEEVKDTDTAA